MSRDDVIRMARDVWGPSAALMQFADIERFAALVAAHEREECAEVCEQYEDGGGTGEVWGPRFAAVIRARGDS